MKITEFAQVSDLTADNIFLLDGSAGTKTIAALNLAKALLGLAGTQNITNGIKFSELAPGSVGEFNADDRLMFGTDEGNKGVKLEDSLYAIVDAIGGGSALKRSIWRGKKIGGVVTDDQYAAIADGSFRDLFIGDYWEIGGRTWRIMDMDYWLWSGASDHICNTHHLVIMPDAPLYEGKMNDTNTTTGGYVGSAMHTSGLDAARRIIEAVFSSEHILKYNEMLVNAVDSTSGVPSGSSWNYIDVCLPNNPMIYGSYTWEQTKNVNPSRYSVSNNILAAIALKPSLTNCNSARRGYWLREPVNLTTFFQVTSTRHIGVVNASNIEGVRPVFGVIG